MGRLGIVSKKNGGAGEDRPTKRGGRPTRELLLNLYLLKNLEKPNKKWLTMYIITILTGGGELVHVN